MSLAFVTPCEGHIPRMSDEECPVTWRLTSHFSTMAWRLGGNRAQMHSHTSTPTDTLLCKYAVHSSTLKNDLIGLIQVRPRRVQVLYKEGGCRARDNPSTLEAIPSSQPEPLLL